MDLIAALAKYWPLIISVIGLIVISVKMNWIDSDHEKRITMLEHQMENITPIWVDIKERLVRIETTLELINKIKNE